MSDEQYGFPEETENTATQERARAEWRVENAERGTVRTGVVVSMMEAAIAGVRELHVENGYAPKLRAIFRS